MNYAPGRPLTRVTHLVAHHSKTLDGQTLSVDDIHRYHTSWRHNGRIVSVDEAMRLRTLGHQVTPPWDDGGYHYLAEFVEGFPTVIVGRPIDRTGAHCSGHNRHTVGVCFIGDYDREAPPRALLEAVAHRVAVPVLDRFTLTPEAIVGDRDFHPSKTCPGERFDLDAFRRLVCEVRSARR